MAVRGWGGGQAAGVGRVRGLAGRGGVICKSEHKLEQARALGSGFWVQVGRTRAGRQGGGPGSSFKQRVERRLLVHHGSVGLGAGRLGLPVGLAEDAVLAELLHTGQSS